MRISAAVCLLAAGLAPVTAATLAARGDQTVIIDNDLEIPGESPLTLCDEDHSADILKITRVDLTPNPPKAGTELMIQASGVVGKRIELGAYVLLQVKYGLIRLISTKADLCDQIKNVDLECPIEKGQLSISKGLDLPGEIPPGKYTVKADVYTKDHEKMTCLEATVIFSRNPGGGLFASFDL